MKIKENAGFRGWCLALLALSCIIQQPAEATPTSGTFYWTTYGASNAYGYGSFSWDGASLSAGTTQLALLPGLSVDGSLAIGSDGNIYSGRAGGVSQINPSTGAVVSVVSGVNSNATSIDPTRMTLYVGWKGVTPLATLPTGNSFGPGTVHPLSGDNTNATGLAWDGNGTVWYTTGGEDVLGDVGTIDLATFTTTRRLSAISATAITFDPFTGAIFTAGINGIAQINPATGTVVSTWLNPQGTGLFIQNLAATGTGHLIALDSNGLLRIWDFSSGSGLIGGPGTIEASTSTQVTDGGMALAALPVGLPVITSPLVATGTVGLPFIYQFTASGATLLEIPGSVAPGLTFNTSLGAITGKPTTVGVFQVGLRATNSQGITNATLTINVQPVPSGPVIVSSTAATGRTGRPFSFQLQTKGGSSATHFAVDSLPPGLNLDPSTGFISGVPTADGSSSLAISAIDGAATTNATLQLTFTSDPTVPIITSNNSAILTPGQPFTYIITADANGTFGYIGTDGIVHQAPSPSCAGLPAGLCFDGDHTISGTYNPPFGHDGGFERVPSLSGGIVTNVQLFATDPSGTGTFPLIGFIATPGTVQISTRLTVGTGDNVLIGGFIIVGTGTTRVLIRAIGPSLAPGVPNVLADPILELREGGTLLASNDNWEDTQGYPIRDTQVPPTNNLESAILAFLSPGAYTATVRGQNSTTGNAVVEVYDLGIAAFEPRGDARLANISTRGTALTGDNVIIGGFFVRPEAPDTSTRVVVRAIGPSLPVPGALGDPTLELRNSNGGLIDANDNWRSDHEAEIIATTIPPSNDLESAIVRNLTAGAYTAIIQGSGGTTGVALVEVYALQ